MQQGKEQNCVITQEVFGGVKMANRRLSDDIWRSTTTTQAAVAQEDTQEDITFCYTVHQWQYPYLRLGEGYAAGGVITL